MKAQLKNNYLQNRFKRINQMLEKYLPLSEDEPIRLHQAMRYAVLNGGKRIRPLFVYTVGETFGAKLEALDIPACTVEFIHCYSLIHDDLPAMDNDDFRRGKPTCHKAFDEATAILAGDALFNLAFQVLVESNLIAKKRLQMIDVITKASGSEGMAAGQAIDLAAANSKLDLRQLEHMHQLKTGALICASAKLGALTANNINQHQLVMLEKYVQCMGLAFQIQDDILDADEVIDNKVTYVSLLGIEQAKNKFQELYEQALMHLTQLDIDTSLLKNLTEYIIQLKH